MSVDQKYSLSGYMDFPPGPEHDKLLHAARKVDEALQDAFDETTLVAMRAVADEIYAELTATEKALARPLTQDDIRRIAQPVLDRHFGYPNIIRVERDPSEPTRIVAHVPADLAARLRAACESSEGSL